MPRPCGNAYDRSSSADTIQQPITRHEHKDTVYLHEDSASGIEHSHSRLQSPQTNTRTHSSICNTYRGSHRPGSYGQSCPRLPCTYCKMVSREDMELEFCLRFSPGASLKNHQLQSGWLTEEQPDCCHSTRSMYKCRLSPI